MLRTLTSKPRRTNRQHRLKRTISNRVNVDNMTWISRLRVLHICKLSSPEANASALYLEINNNCTLIIKTTITTRPIQTNSLFRFNNHKTIRRRLIIITTMLPLNLKWWRNLTNSKEYLPEAEFSKWCPMVTDFYVLPITITWHPLMIYMFLNPKSNSLVWRPEML